MHAPLPPSSAKCIVACPGFRAVLAAYPDTKTIESREGDAVHWAGAAMLRGGVIAVGQVADNGVTLTEEMVEASEDYAGYILTRDFNDINTLGKQFGVEEQIATAALHEQNYGTPDYWRYAAHDNHLFIDDLKYGHRFVDERFNWQLMNYAALVARKIDRYGDDTLKITMTIHQPRAYHRRGTHRAQTVTLGQLRPYLRKLSEAFRAGMAPDAPVIASDPEACRDCPGRHACEAHIAATYDGVDLAYESAPLVMTPRAMSKHRKMLMRAEKFIVAQREGLDAMIESTIRGGKAVPYFNLAPKVGRRVWKADAMQQGLVEVAAAYGADVMKPGLITPLQALKAKIPEEVVKQYSHQPAGGVELIEEDGSEAARFFEN